MNRSERTRTAVSDRARPAPWWRILPAWARQELVLLLREPVAAVPVDPPDPERRRRPAALPRWSPGACSAGAVRARRRGR
ncbi:MAG: hypothetical protein DI576_06865 [Actinomyces sp.]|nr:MAG: hypothetical protein DI576_06865 [Actinomyces sp.]